MYTTHAVPACRWFWSCMPPHSLSTVHQKWREKTIPKAPTNLISTHPAHKWSVACLLLLLLPRPARPLLSPSSPRHGAGVGRGAWCVPRGARLADPTCWSHSAHTVLVAATRALMIAHSQLEARHHRVTSYFMSPGVTSVTVRFTCWPSAPTSAVACAQTGHPVLPRRRASAFAAALSWRSHPGSGAA